MYRVAHSLGVLIALTPVLLDGQADVTAFARIVGDGVNAGVEMVLDRAGNIYVTGSTTSTDLATPGVVQKELQSSSLVNLTPAATTPLRLPASVSVNAVGVFQAVPTRVLVGTDRGLFVGGLGDDAGWVQTFRGEYVSTVAVGRADSEIGFAAVGAGSSVIYRSVDGGRNWAASSPLHSSGLVSVSGIAVNGSDSASLIVWGTERSTAGAAAASFQSTDGGVHWGRTSVPLSGASFNSDGSTVFGVSASGSIRSVVKSVDNGSTWTHLAATGLTFPSGVLAHPVDDKTLYVYGSVPGAEGFSGILASTDGGLNWRQAQTGLDVQQLLGEAGGTVCVRTRDRIYRTPDGFATRATPVSPVFPEYLFRAIGIVDHQSVIAGFGISSLGGTRDVFVQKLTPTGELVFSTYLGGFLAMAAG